MSGESEIPTLSYATAGQQIRSRLLGILAGSFTLVAGIVGIFSFIFEFDLGGLVSFGLGAIGFILSVVAIARVVSRTGTALISLGLSILYWIGAFVIETYLGNIG
jgi:hypothetical protein